MKTNRKRVVITGMGILSSLADNIEDFRLALLQKENGITDGVRFSEWFKTHGRPKYYMISTVLNYLRRLSLRSIMLRCGHIRLVGTP